MTFNMRQERRDKTEQPAWISVSSSLPLRKCTLIDISDSGAKLALDDIGELPDKFSLWLSRHGHPRYTCRIVWTDQNTIGVQFSSGHEQPSLVRANQ
jgi:hypothetical protein